jgi:hypothetical protein
MEQFLLNAVFGYLAYAALIITWVDLACKVK